VSSDLTAALDSFFAELIAGSDPRPRSTSASAELAALYGAPLAPALAAWVDVFASHEPRLRFGGLGWFGGRGGFTQDWLPGDDDSLAHALGQPFRYPGPLAGALAIGCDHGGNTYFATLFGEVTEIYWHDQDNDVVRLLADSLDAFATLLRRDEGTLPAELADAALAGHVDLGARWDRRGQQRLGAPAVARTDFADRFAATARLRAAITYGDPSWLGEPIAITSDDACAEVVRLLDAYLRGEDARVAELVAGTTGSGSKWLRDVVSRVRAGSDVAVADRARALGRA